MLKLHFTSCELCIAMKIISEKSPDLKNMNEVPIWCHFIYLEGNLLLSHACQSCFSLVSHMFTTLRLDQIKRMKDLLVYCIGLSVQYHLVYSLHCNQIHVQFLLFESTYS